MQVIHFTPTFLLWSLFSSKINTAIGKTRPLIWQLAFLYSLRCFPIYAYTLSPRIVPLRLITIIATSVGTRCIPLVLSVTNLFFSIFLITDFLGEAWHTYFFRRKFSPRRILQVPDALFLDFFQKLFSGLQSIKTFLAQRVK